MLHEFVTRHRDAIVARTRMQIHQRPWPTTTAAEMESGVPLFLDQLVETLRREATREPLAGNAIGDSAAAEGRRLQAQGFTLAQVVHGYGDICQAVAETVIERQAAMSIEEFHTLNRCLDTAIAEAVTEHARATSARRDLAEAERLGQVSHELRNFLNTALLAFRTAQLGGPGPTGRPSALLGETLLRLKDFVGSALTDVRLAADHQRRERVRVATFLADVVNSASLHAEYRDLTFSAEPVDPNLFMTVDPELLASAVNNLLTNAFKYSRAHGHVTVRAQQQNQFLTIAVQDECGGIPPQAGDPFKAFGERRGRDRTGLGLGLSIARKAVRAHGGDIRIDNLAGSGCIFTIEVPLVPNAVEDGPSARSSPPETGVVAG